MMEASRKVMILDDNILDVMEVEGYLRAGGYDVVSLSSSSGALSKIDYERPEILLLDLSMPRLNSKELIETLHASTDHDELVIVLFSSIDAEELKDFCIEHDINGYFCKSMDVSKIATFLDNFYE